MVSAYYALSLLWGSPLRYDHRPGTKFQAICSVEYQKQVDLRIHSYTLGFTSVLAGILITAHPCRSICG